MTPSPDAMPDALERLARECRVKVIGRNGAVAVRLTGFTPLLAAVATLAVAGIILAFAYPIYGAFTGQTNLPQWVIPSGGMVLAALAVTAYIQRSSAVATGREDLVIDFDRRLLDLPLTCGRHHPVIVRFDQVVAIDLAYKTGRWAGGEIRRMRIDPRAESRREMSRTGSGRDEVHYFPMIIHRDEAGEMREESLVKWTERRRAAALARWLHEALEAGRPMMPDA